MLVFGGDFSASNNFPLFLIYWIFAGLCWIFEWIWFLRGDSIFIDVVIWIKYSSWGASFVSWGSRTIYDLLWWWWHQYPSRNILSWLDGLSCSYGIATSWASTYFPDWWDSGFDIIMWYIWLTNRAIMAYLSQLAVLPCTNN